MQLPEQLWLQPLQAPLQLPSHVLTQPLLHPIGDSCAARTTPGSPESMAMARMGSVAFAAFLKNARRERTSFFFSFFVSILCFFVPATSIQADY